MDNDKKLEVLIGDCFTHISTNEIFIVVSKKEDLHGTSLELWHESRFKEREKKG